MRRFAEIEGHRIAYHREGSGPPMLLLHGITTYSFLWKEMAEMLSREFDAIAIDLLGCGDSDKPLVADYGIAAQAELTVKFLDGLGIDRAHIVSHDIGGGIAQILAVKHPERVRSLVLINTVGYDYWPVQPVVSLRVPMLRQIALSVMDAGIMRLLVRWGFFHKDKVTDELMSKFRRPLMTHDGREGLLALAKSLDNRHLMDVARGFPEIRCPVLIIRGDADVYLKPIISQRIHREIPGSRLEVIRTAGHFAPLDEPEAIAGLVSGFIGASNMASGRQGHQA